MRTSCRSLFGFRVVLLSLAAALLLAPGFQEAVQAQTPPCAVSAAPMCDGECPPSQACVVVGQVCACVEVQGEPCGLTAPWPQCWGACPPLQACVDAGQGLCQCQVVPTLSEWGIIGMSLVMFGGVLVLRRRAASRT